MSEQENLKLVQNAYDAFKRGDVNGVLGTLADDVQWTTPGPSNIMPFAGKRRGREEVANFFKALSDAEDVLEFEPKEFIAQGDKVAVVGNYSGRVKSTGKTATTEWVHVFTISNGKVTNFREYFDTAIALEAYKTGTQTAGAS